MNKIEQTQQQMIALFLRVGLALVFIIGGTSKLLLLLTQATHQGMVDNYMGTSGYINTFFQEFLFSNGVLTPSAFLTSLSAFELISGLMLLAGVLVRPIALIYGFMLWSFVIALPVMTVPGEIIEVKTYQSPAILVQIRDITLSGFMFILFALGAGRFSMDAKWFKHEKSYVTSWEHYGLLLRISMAVTLLVAGSFAGMPKIQSFQAMPLLLLMVALVILFAPVLWQRLAGGILIAIMIYFISTKLSLDKSIIANLNGFKREFAFIAAGLVLAVFAGGSHFTLMDILKRSVAYIQPSKLVTD